jgi:platelet-activating factor acetylhydrolase
MNRTMFLLLYVFYYVINISILNLNMCVSNNIFVHNYRGTCHQSVTDFQFLVKKPIGKFLDVCHTLSPKKAIDISNKATLGFLRKHLGINYSFILETRTIVVVIIW